ncbi:RteC domain-containing protein [Niastella vici]|nr:RteC domain-containing protein [Niastella vici]
MKYSSQLTEISQVYKLIVQEIEQNPSEANEGKWIERSFGLVVKTWLNIEEMISNYQFSEREEELYFYKNLKPEFIGLIEYFTLLYKSVVFQPDDSMKKVAYWKHELKSCRELVGIYNSGCQYYEQHLSNLDIYFLEQTNQQPLLFGLNISRVNVTDTSYSYLRGRLIAMKKYEAFILGKLHENTDSLENQLFFDRHSSAN